jgi:hypothetical protein
MTKKPDLLFAGVPLLLVVALCAAAYAAGAYLHKQPEGKYVTANKSAVIFTAVMEMQSAASDEAQLKKRVTDPVIALLRRYTDQGYVVIDTAKDDHGNMSIVALPEGTKDITQELSTAVGIKETSK